MLEGLKHPLAAALGFFQIDQTMQVCQVVSDRRSVLIFLRNRLLVVVWLFNVFYDTVINRLVCLFVRKSEPSALKFILLRSWLPGVVEFSDAKHNDSSRVLDSPQLDLNFSVIIYF